MMSRSDDQWPSESRLDRQNSVVPDGYSGLPDANESPPKPRSTRRRQPSVLRDLAVPLAIVLVVSGVAIYALAR